ILQSACLRRGCCSAAPPSRAGPTGRVSTDGRSTAEAWPVPEWLPRQGPVVVFRLSGDFDPQPWRAVEDLVLMAKLDLGDDEAAILAGEHVHFPGVAVPGNYEARFFDQAAMA